MTVATRPSTPAEAFTALHHIEWANHQWTPGCCTAVTFTSARLVDQLAGLGWTLVPTVSLPDTTPAGDPRTADGDIDDLSDRQWAVWWVLSYYGPSTDEELAARYDAHARGMHRAGTAAAAGRYLPAQSEQSLRSRRAELVRAGHVIATGRSRPTRSGRSARVWAVTEGVS